MPQALTSAPELDGAVHGWTVHEFPEVSSTNELAAPLPPWTAVGALVQTAGRGRVGRSWVSSEGGLWFSATVPAPGDAAQWALLPLAAGWAALTVVRARGVRGARLRWPNDLLVGRRKLAGILVERFSPACAVIGIGMNLTNQPEAADPALQGQTVRLADLVPEIPSRTDLLAELLAALRREHGRLEAADTAGLCRDLNAAWQHRKIHVTLAGGRGALSGHLDGVDPHGSLLLRSSDGETLVLPPHRVELLREVF